jgi:hypothetical protein
MLHDDISGSILILQGFSGIVIVKEVCEDDSDAFTNGALVGARLCAKNHGRVSRISY